MPILSQICNEISQQQALEMPPEFYEDMFALMAEKRGVGLAAPQVGIPLRIFVMNYGAITTEFINPVITATPGKVVTSHDEGCLSFPGLKVSRKRHKRVTIEGYNRHWEPLRFDLRGLAAFIVQHEIDHLNGITIARASK
jgi:peptide deformylase